jgi:hypothetical protein
MSNEYPVVVYGASGYTGRLVIEFLREYGIRFVAVGRNRARVEEALKLIPGIENADYQVAEVEHTVESLTELLKDKKVICNTVGPFARFGETVIEAALEAGCHYLDTTGEQAWMIDMQDKYHEKFQTAGLVCSPATAYMYTVSDIAARICLETPGVDSLDVRFSSAGLPTIASTQSVVDMCRNPSYRLENNQLVPYQEAFELEPIALPGSGSVLNSAQWGGGSHVAFFRNDGRVRNCNMRFAPLNQEMLTGLKELELAYKVQLQWLPQEMQYLVLDQLAGEVQGDWPPRENRQVNRFVDWCYGRGNNVSSKCVIHGSCSYQITGLLQAYSAMRLVDETPSKAGFCSINEVLGHRDVLAAIQGYGYVSMIEESRI